MRARNLKPGFFKNAELADAGPHAQLLFAGLWLMADKEGRLKDQPRVLKAEVFPYYDVDVNGELTVIERLGHIRRYMVNGIAVIEVLNFKKHQSPHHTEKASELPAFEAGSLENTGSPEIHGEVTVKSRKRNGGNPSDSLIPDSLNHDSSPSEQSGPKKQTKSKTEIPEDFGLTPERQAYAEKHLPNVNAAALMETFRSTSKAKAWKYADWDQAWQTLVRNWAPNSGHWSSGQYPVTPIAGTDGRPAYIDENGVGDLSKVRWA